MQEFYALFVVLCLWSRRSLAGEVVADYDHPGQRERANGRLPGRECDGFPQGPRVTPTDPLMMQLGSA
jgi:hypothetical protein